MERVSVGSLRLMLALLVLASHAGVRIKGLNLGVSSVVMFYAISGYVMSALMERHYSQVHQAPRYYQDRLLRLYPQYLAWIVLTWGWQRVSGYTGTFLQHPVTSDDLFNNLMIVPLNYYMFNGADQYTLIPPAWSLGAEIQFYFLAPWLWRWRRLAALLATGSLSIQMLSWFGHLDGDWWGYRLLPGTLWIFVLGMTLQRQYRKQTAWVGSLMAILILFVLQQCGRLQTPYHLEVLLGVALALPLIAVLAPLHNSLWSAIDEQLGQLSYGVFLNHFLLLYIFPTNANSSIGQWGALLGLSLALSWVTQTIFERPVMQWRRKWRFAH